MEKVALELYLKPPPISLSLTHRLYHSLDTLSTTADQVDLGVEL